MGPDGPGGFLPGAGEESGAGSSEGLCWSYELDLAGLLAAIDRVQVGDPSDQEASLAEEREAAEAGPGTVRDLTGVIADQLPAGPGLAGWLANASPGELADWDLPGVAAAYRRVASWAQAGELAAVAQITSRAAARGDRAEVDEDGRPDRVTASAASEVSLALAMSQVGASWWAGLAVELGWRLRRTGAALAAGAIDLPRAKLVAEATGPLTDEDAQAVEDLVLPGAGGQTTGQLRAALRRAVLQVDPRGAEERRQNAERRAKVSLYPDEVGTAALVASNLPGVLAAAAMARISALARGMKASGAGGGIDLLRAQVLIGLLLGTLPLIPAAPGSPPDPGPGNAGPGEPGPGEPGPGGSSGDQDDGPGGGDADDRPGGWDGPGQTGQHGDGDGDAEAGGLDDGPGGGDADDRPGGWDGPGQTGQHGDGDGDAEAGGPDVGPGSSGPGDDGHGRAPDGPGRGAPGPPAGRRDHRRPPDLASDGPPSRPSRPGRRPARKPARPGAAPDSSQPDSSRPDSPGRSPSGPPGSDSRQAGSGMPGSGPPGSGLSNYRPFGTGPPGANLSDDGPSGANMADSGPPAGYPAGEPDEVPPLTDADAPADDDRQDGPPPDPYGGWDHPDDDGEDRGIIAAWPPLPATMAEVPPALGGPPRRYPDGLPHSPPAAPGDRGEQARRPQPGLLDLTVSWHVLTGNPTAPARMGRLGPISTAEALPLAVLAVADPAAQWRVILTDPGGRAITVERVRRGHLCDNPGRPAGITGRVTVAVPAAILTTYPPRGTGVGAPGGTCEPWTGRGIRAAVLRAARRAAARAEKAAAADAAAGGCAHTIATSAYRPPARIREYVVARDQTCRQPYCGQPAWRADLDHTTPWHKGGLTCPCNIGGGCRTHHQIKQQPGWTLHQPTPGTFQWTTPTGRTYITQPDTYPI